MDIFEQYGIKEVADVTLYSIQKKQDGSEDIYYVPSLYFDTLRISSVDKTADNTWAQGGLGNSRLICWDYNKLINITLEDALCTPASLGLCWGGILSTDWKDAEIKQDFGISFNEENAVEKVTRMEKAYYPSSDREKTKIINLLPFSLMEKNEYPDSIKKLEEIKISGYGYVSNRRFNWNIKVNTSDRSITTYPEKVIKKNGSTEAINPDVSITPVIYADEARKISVEYTLQSGKILRILVDNDNNYSAKIKEVGSLEWEDTTDYNLKQFERIDMYLQFSGLNKLLYFLLTKYEDNITFIPENELWTYVNPETMKPYDDDFWFYQGEVYYIKTLTFINNTKHEKPKQIIVKAGVFPGMYMLVGETLIRNRETQEDERFQIKIPFCKVKSDQQITLEAEGEPTVFNLDLEAATSMSGTIMELTKYNTKKRILIGKQEDGSTKIINE